MAKIAKEGTLLDLFETIHSDSVLLLLPQATRQDFVYENT